MSFCRLALAVCWCAIQPLASVCVWGGGARRRVGSNKRTAAVDRRLAAAGGANKADHDALMARSTAKRVRVGIHNKLEDPILVFDHTHDHGKSSQLHLDPMLTVPPGALEHWFTEERRFFRLVPSGKEWHGEGVHVVTSGEKAAGRNFEIGAHDDEEVRQMYPDEMHDEMHDEMMMEDRHPRTYNIETVVYEHEHELR